MQTKNRRLLTATLASLVATLSLVNNQNMAAYSQDVKDCFSSEIEYMPGSQHLLNYRFTNNCGASCKIGEARGFMA